MEREINKSTKKKREEMSRKSWIKNVLRIYPQTTREQAEQLYNLLNALKTKP